MRTIVVMLVVLVCGVARGQGGQELYEQLRDAETQRYWARMAPHIERAKQKHLEKNSVKIEGQQPRQWLFTKPLNGKKGIVAKVTKIYHGKEQQPGMSDVARPSEDHIKLETTKAQFWVSVDDLKAADKKYLAKLQEKK